MNKFAKILKIIALTLAGLIIFVVLLLGAMTLWLTPERLTDLFNREASKYVNADIRAKNINYTLWSSFPRFNISTDSIIVISRNFNDISPELRSNLPLWADTLAELKSFHGGINVVDIFLHRYVIHDVRINGLNVNIVAVNDSLTNYNIFPTSDKGFKRIPYISAHSIELKNPGAMRYRSLATNTNASVLLSNLFLKRNPAKMGKDTYTLELAGNANVTSAGITVLNGFPFSLFGNLQLKFKPFGVRLENYTINLGQIKSSLNMSVGMGDDPGIEHFDYHISTINLMSLLGYLPKDLLPSLQGIEANLPVSASARLMSAWNFSSETLPQIAIDFNIPAGELIYTAAANRLPMRYSGISGTFFFNGPDPTQSYFRINPFNVAADDMDLDVSANVSQLTTSPLVEANVELKSDLKSLPKYLPGNYPIDMKGHASLKTLVAFNISGFSIDDLKKGVQNLSLEGNINVDNAEFKSSEQNLDLKIDRLSAPTSASIAVLTPDAIVNPQADVTFKISSLKGNVGTQSVAAKNLSVTSGTHINGKALPENILKKKPLNLSIKASELQFDDPADNIALTALNPMLNLDISLSNIGMQASSKSSTSSPQMQKTISLSGIRVRKTADSIPYPHTPLLLSFDVPDNVKELFSQINFNTSLKLDSLRISGKGFNPEDCLTNLDMAVSNDSFSLNSANLLFQNTRAAISGKIGNISNFLFNPPSESNPLDFDLNLALDTVNINALAKAYVDSKGGMKNIPEHNTTTSSDSVSLLIPRNIRGNLNFSAMETIYMNLHLYNLAARVKVAQGNLYIPNLGIDADFGKAKLNLDYTTADPQNMGINGDLAIEDVNIVNFFKNFHTLLLMMPEMKNLSGMLSADMNFAGSIFPDMYINMPSVDVKMLLRGWDLKVHQSDFIRKITKMMLIRSDNDIHIRNLDVHAAIHDNLLQLDPFNFEFDNYRLNMEGINNFNGRLYYHLAVEKSPVPIPFSVNIEGMFSHPKLRFGGGRYDLKRGEEVTARVQENNNVNMVKILKQFMRLFIKKAAESPGE